MSAALEARREEALALMQRVMRSGRDTSSRLELEYPTAIGEARDARATIAALEEEGAARSACVLATRRFLCAENALDVGLIGSVSTDSDWRGRGLATRLLEQCEAELARRGCALALLWADDPRFYLSRGWRPIGLEWDLWIGREQARVLPQARGTLFDLEPRHLRPAQERALVRLHAGHELRVQRELCETLALLEVPGMRALALERQGELVAYACLGRGSDLPGVVHEWGGEPEDVLALLRAFEARGAVAGKGMVLLCSGRDQAMLDACRARGFEAHAGVLGLGKLVDLPRAGQLFERISAGALACTPRASGLEVRGPTGSLVLDATATLELLAAARADRTRAVEVEAACGLALPALPLPLFAWGLDSL